MHVNVIILVILSMLVEICFNIPLIKYDFIFFNYFFYAKLSDKESKSLLVWSHKIEIVKAKNFRCSWITTFCEFLRLNLVFDFKLLKWSKL